MLRKIAKPQSHKATKSQVGKELFLTSISALLLILSFPNFTYSLIAWIGFVPLFFVLQGRSKRQAFLFSYLCGLIFWSGIIYWLIHVTLPGTIILILYLALYFGFFGLALSYNLLRTTNYALFLVPSIWVLLEYIRAYLFTGFPWALLGYSQYLNLTLIQIADLTGAWGVSFLVMMGNVAVWSCLKSPGSFLVRLRKCTLPLLCVLAALIYGWLAIEEDLSAKTKKSSLGPKISVIQGNIAQELKWDVNAKAYILQKYFRFTELAATDGPDLVIWPEAASPGILGEEPWCWIDIFSLARRLNTPLIIGTVTREQDKYFNSALLVDRTEKSGLRYDKLHLVPFGEFVPLKKFLPFLETVVPIGDISRGREYTIFEIRDRLQPLSKTARKFAVLICFEDLFPELSREFTKRGIDFLVNITNDAWYKKTAASYQHLQGSVFRAIENRRFLVRAANTGISGFIGSTGKILSIVKDASGQAIFVDGYKTMRISVLGRGLSFYTRFGDIFIFLCLAFVLYGIIRALKIKKSKVFNPSQKSPGL